MAHYQVAYYRVDYFGCGGVLFTRFYYDFIIKQGIQRVGCNVLGTPVTVGDVSLGLLEGRLTLSDLKVENPKGYKQKYAFTFRGSGSEIRYGFFV